ncbi:MAG: M1 family metallopeptidase [Bacteroidales bacterium]|nr:M1 family metallopeptidase [Bacteroidales bacterium]
MKRTNNFALFTLLFVSCSLIQAQNSGLIIPVNHQRAIKEGTRTNTGIPGEKYFQNRADYKISAEFDPFSAKLKGSEIVAYKNNSPDTIKYLVIRLYQNIFKDDAARQVQVNAEDLHSGVKIKKLSIGENVIPESNFRFYGTNLIVPIPGKLFPASTIKLNVEWESDLPNKTNLRMGRYDTASYFVAYWYPQISVYDDISGWCVESYNGVQEFYNDYGSFDVEITAPKGFVVWATGELQNAGKIFSEQVLERIEKSKKTDNLVRIITAEDFKNKTIFAENQENKWHFSADFVSDFAFGLSDKYVWDAAGTVVDKKSGRRAVVNSVYKTGSKDGEGIAEIGAKTIKKLSEELIGIPYPYSHNTVWEGHGGMEFPMMCNDGPVDDFYDKVFVTAHEISHSYFPFLVGTNETHFAWMDEGLITFIPKAIELEYGNKNAHYYVSAYGRAAMGTINDLPLIIPSTQMTGSTYMMQNYGRAATGFYFVHDIIGAEMFKKVLKEFVTRWEGKHPLPTDFVNTLNFVTGEDWAWFWNPWFYEFGYADLSLDNVVIENGSIKLKVKKSGIFPVPVKLTINFEDGSTDIIRETAKIWKNSEVWSFEKTYKKTVVSIELGDKDIPDAFLDDNSFTY